MKITKKLTAVALLTALTVSTLAGCGKSESAAANAENGLQTLRVAIMTGQADQYATYIGTEQGIFEKYGIVLETAEYAAGINTIDAVQNGTADTGLLADFAAVNRLGNTLHATNLVIFSELSATEPAIGGLYVAPQYADDLSTLDGSEGFITNIGTVTEYFNWQAQTYLGLDPAKQNSVPTDSNQTSLALAQNGGASAIVAYGSNGKYYEEQGWKLAVNASDIGIKVGSYLLTTEEFLADNKDLLADYLKALDESAQYIHDNLDESAEKISAKFGIKAEDFKLNWQAQVVNIGLTEEGAVQLDGINDWAFSQGKYEEAYNVRDFIDTSVAEAAFPGEVTVEK